MDHGVALVSRETQLKLQALMAVGAQYVKPGSEAGEPMRFAGFNTGGMVRGTNFTLADIEAAEQFMGGGVKVFQRVGFTQFRTDTNLLGLYGHNQIWLAGPSLQGDGTIVTVPYLIVGTGAPAAPSDPAALVPTAKICCKGIRLGDNYHNGLSTGVELSTEPTGFLGYVKDSSTDFRIYLAGNDSFWVCQHKASPSGADEYSTVFAVPSGHIWSGGTVRAGTGFAYGNAGGLQSGVTTTTGGLTFAGGILVGGAVSLTSGGGTATAISGAGAGDILYSNGSSLQSTSAANITSGRFQVDVGTDRQISFTTGSF